MRLSARERAEGQTSGGRAGEKAVGLTRCVCMGKDDEPGLLRSATPGARGRERGAARLAVCCADARAARAP